MDINKVIAKVYTTNGTTSIKYTNILNIYDSDPFIGTKYFINWANKLKTSKFQIVSTVHDFNIVFTIYSRLTNTNIEYIIIVKVNLNDIASEKSYKINSQIESTDIENISDIVSLLIRMSANLLPHFQSVNILRLIDFQMKRIGVLIE